MHVGSNRLSDHVMTSVPCVKCVEDQDTGERSNAIRDKANQDATTAGKQCYGGFVSLGERML